VGTRDIGQLVDLVGDVTHNRVGENFYCCHNLIFNFFYFVKELSEMIKIKNELKFRLKTT
jgi:hypothetical protein